MDSYEPFLRSALFLAVLLALALASGAVGRTIPLILSLLLMMFGCVTALTFALTGAVLLLPSVAYQSGKLSWRRYALVSAAVWLLPLATSWAIIARELRPYQQLQAQYPPVDLQPRLAYEGSTTSPSDIRDAESAPPPLGLEAMTGITEVRQVREAEQASYHSRSSVLQDVHERTYKHFVAAMGFGPVRMMRLRPEEVELPPIGPVRLVCEPPDRGAQSTDVPDPPPRTRLLDFHWSGAGDFLNRDRMGYVPTSKVALGFQPHAMSAATSRLLDGERWQITRLELVSLKRFGGPRVYETENLPNLEELSSRDIPTRALDEFEAAALPELSLQQDLVVNEAALGNHIQMLGALRADDDCRQCHDVGYGELLGAFSYELRPRWAVPPVEGP